ncbi:MAG TPA: cysteine--tRNA ligase [Candidatus Elarobacter sp.]|nr:cysteine--tRNA ligase [Candidatus Elarobacter sp.]
MPLRLYNTRTRRVEPLQPLEPDHVRIYVCGLTPSAEGHLGHARSFLFFDVLRRYLEHPRNGYRVTFVKNVTDVDDRSIATAAAEKTTFDVVIARHYASFRASMAKLDVREPDHEPFATQYVPQIVEMIGELVERGYAYASEDGVYYRVAAFQRYGALSGKNVDELLVGARIAENEHKDDPLDFALWKFAKPGEPRWDSPWGAGRPGWHIECSAMSRALLGVPFDIHGGGYDLVFPHHENEIAQSEPLMDAPPMAEVWVHGGLLNFDGRKMSKSLGNFEPISALLERHDPLAIRLLFLQTGYRKPMNFTEDSIAGATRSLQRLTDQYQRARELREDGAPLGEEAEAVIAYRERFFEQLDDDMNTAGGLGTIFDLAGDAGHYRDASVRGAALDLIRDAFRIFGIEAALEREHRVAFDEGFVARLRDRLGDAAALNGAASPEDAIAAVIDARNAARKGKDFARSDLLRDALGAEGVQLHDGKDGTTWTRAGG